jgi:hypothetical protein
MKHSVEAAAYGCEIGDSFRLGWSWCIGLSLECLCGGLGLGFLLLIGRLLFVLLSLLLLALGSFLPGLDPLLLGLDHFWKSIVSTLICYNGNVPRYAMKHIKRSTA